ncbi:methyl-CpG binding domain protein [Pimephales promelas]|nr:methyl-CpG binding domain protein [Pimephales promelas]
MTDELNMASAEPETMNPQETVPALLSENHLNGADVATAVEDTEWDNMPGIVTVELPPDWLKPMEEDEDGVEGVRSIPKVKRRRGRPPNAKNVRQGLTRLDFKKGRRMDRTRRTKSVLSQLEITKRSSLSSRTATPRPDPTHTPKVLPRTIQSIIHSSTSTPQSPQGPRLTPCSPAGVRSLSNTPNAEFNSPPRLTRVSPLNIDTSRTRDFIHSPSVKVGNVSQQFISSSSEPGKDGSELPLRLWLYPSLEPISPTKTQDDFISDHVFSPDFPDSRLNGTMGLKESHPVLSKCENCGSPFSAQKPGDTLCFRCRPKSEKKYSPPNIVFRKVGQDQWEVGKTKHPRKQILKPHPKYKKIDTKDFVPDGGDDEDWAQKKRSRRMCRQCDACLREDDCGICDFCMDKPKYGGSNKKRQKCRLRQCKFESKLHGANRKQSPSLSRRRGNMKPKLKRRGRSTKKRRFRSKPWEDDDDDDDDDDEDEMSEKDNDEDEGRPFKMNGSKARGKKKWNYSFKEEDDDMFIEAVIEDDEPSNVEEDPDILDNERSMMASNVMYSNTSGLGAQGLYYNMPVAPHMLGSVPMCNNNQMPLGEVIGSLPMGDDATQNGFLQIEMVRVGSPPSHFTEEPQNTQQHMLEHQQEATPMVSHTRHLSPLLLNTLLFKTLGSLRFMF